MADESILVPATLPPTPLVLADAQFLVGLAAVEQTVAKLAITDAATAQQAADLLVELTKADRTLEQTRDRLKKPFRDIGTKIDDVAKLVNSRIFRSKAALSTLLGTWNEQEQKRLAAERRKRDEELVALEKQKEAEAAAEEERQAKLAAATPAPVGDGLDFDFDGNAAPVPVVKTATEQRIEQLKYAPVAAAPRPTGVAFKTALRFSISDASKLPDQFIIRTPNDLLIRQTYCVGYKEGDPLPEVPGVKFVTERTAVSTGRAAQ